MSVEHFNHSCGLLRWLARWAVLICLISTLDGAETRRFLVIDKFVVTEEVTLELVPQFRAMRFNEAGGEWNVDLVITNGGARTFSLPVFAVIESVQNAGPLLNPSGLTEGDPQKPFVRVFQSLESLYTLAPGDRTPPKTLRFPFVAGNAVPSLRVKVFAAGGGDAPLALALTRTLNEAGQPIPGVEVTEFGPETTRTVMSDPSYGVVTLGQTRGVHSWKFEAPGRFPVWRTADLALGEVALIHTPRLVLRSTSALPVGPLGGALMATPSLRVDIPPGALSEPAELFTTPLDSQALPAPLPLGWSPLLAFWFELNAELKLSASALWKMEDGLISGTTPVLVRWNSESLSWDALELPVASSGGSLVLRLASVGAYAVVAPDAGALVPPQALLGKSLMPVLSPVGPFNLTARGVVTPQSRPPSRDAEAVTALASLVLSNNPASLPSGFRIRGQIEEDYQLKDGTRRRPPGYEQDLIAYQRPGDSLGQTLHAAFPMRPIFLYGADELASGRVSMEVLTLGSYEGQILRPSGGFVRVGGITVRAAAGSYETPQAALIRLMDPAAFAELLLPGFLPRAAFDLTVAETLSGRRLDLEISGQGVLRSFVLCRVLMLPGIAGLQPVQRMVADRNGIAVSSEPSSGPRLPGVRGAERVLVDDDFAAHEGKSWRCVARWAAAQRWAWTI